MNPHGLTQLSGPSAGAKSLRPLALGLLLLLLLAPAAPTLAAAPWVPESAHGEAGRHGDEPRLEARLLVDAGRAEADRVRIGVLFDLDPGWHLYWRNSGDTGLPTELDIRSPGATIGEIQWPTPSGYSEADGAFTTFGYSERVLLMTDLTLDPAFAEERALRVDADVLICKTECIPAGVSLERSLTEALVDSPDNVAITALFEDFEGRLPVAPASLGVELEALYDRSALPIAEKFEAALAVHACRGEGPCRGWRPASGVISFFPASDEPAILRDAGRVLSADEPDTRIVPLTGETTEDASPGVTRLQGVLALRADDGETRGVLVDLPLPIAAAGASVETFGAHWLAGSEVPPPAAAASVGAFGLLNAILLALLGGLILNLMPCVLPVLAIKVFAVAEMAGRSRRELLMNGGAYAAGILLSMGVLATVVLALRGIGTQVGWGFQFQSPIFIAVISIVLVAFAMNLFGAFEISPNLGGAAQIGADSVGTRRSFFEGLLAVVLATPCSAPFLGTAVGFAFASSPAVIVAIFLSIGAGLAAPFVAITLVPGWARFMPRSGPWMMKLRAGLGFALLATVIWLMWITGGVAGVDGMIALLCLLLAVAFGLFLYGAVQTSERGWLRLASGLSLVVLAVVGLDLIRAQLAGPEEGATPVELAATGEGWEPWAPAAIEAALAEGDPVLVVFSAEWCITCKVNERVVLRSPQVESELARLGVRVFKADWTRRDETIRAELARHGRAGVPLYLVYDPRRPEEPRLLPELLSVGEVVDSLRAATVTTRAEAATGRAESAS